MNCKSLYRGSLSSSALKKVSKKVLYAIAAALFDNFTFTSRTDLINLLRPVYYQVADICDRLGLDEVEVVEQYPSSLFYIPYKCNFRVRFSSNRVYSTYSIMR